MRKKTPQRPNLSKAKLAVAGVFFALVWTGLWIRAGYIQLYKGPHLEQLASKQNLATDFERGRRGRIYARDGELLATSVDARSAYLRPLEVENRALTAKSLSHILGMSLVKTQKILASNKNFVWIKRQISDREAVALDKAGLPGVFLTPEFVRLYPQGSLAGQVLGFVNVDGKGLEGMELSLDRHMAGGKAEFVVQRDASGRRLYLDASGREIDIDGGDVRLTLDTHIQDVTEQALQKAVTEFGAREGVAVVVKVATGEVLAMANYPFFNPNVYRQSKPSIRRNRAALDVYEPGSTMKPFLFAAALQEGVLSTDKLIDCENGRYKVGPEYITDHHPYGWLPVPQVLRYSSNIGAAKIAQDLGAQNYYRYLTELGFGSVTGVKLPAESRGMLHDVGKWNEFDLAAASFGQGLGVTALQLAQGYMAVATKGLKRPLRLVLEPAVPQVLIPDRLFSLETAEQVLSMMREVVEEDGTGRFARIPGVPTAGKTGTAQKAEDGGYGDKYLSSFVSLVPGDDPELLIVVMVDEPEKVNAGGKVAAPAAKEIAMRTLAYYGRLPDVAEETEMAEERMTAPQAAPAPEPIRVTTGKVPDLTGLPLRRAVEVLAKIGVVPQLRGQGTTVSKQSPLPGEAWPKPGNSPEQDGKEHVFVLWLS